jgi:hypothetical protein
MLPSCIVFFLLHPLQLVFCLCIVFICSPQSQAFSSRQGAPAGAAVHVVRAGETLRPAAALAFQTDARAAIRIRDTSDSFGTARRLLPPERLEHVDHPLHLARREVPVLHKAMRVPVVHVVENWIEAWCDPLKERCQENDFHK